MTTTTETAPIRVGDVFYASWGYDQTNVDFYQVVGVTASGKSVRLRKIAAERVGEGGGPSEHVRPAIDQFVDDKVLTRRYREGGGTHRGYVKIESWMWAWPTTLDETHSRTGLGWGH